MEEDQATLERILTRDREYSTELMHRIFASNTEESRLTTSRLLASIYEYKGQQNLYVQGLPVEMRVQHYLEQVCAGYYSCVVLVLEDDSSVFPGRRAG
jgi:hypothetical protein